MYKVFYFVILSEQKWQDAFFPVGQTCASMPYWPIPFHFKPCQYEDKYSLFLAMLCREELQVFVDVVITVNAANSWLPATSAPSGASPIF